MTLLMQVPAPVVQLEVTEALSSAISAAAGLCVENRNYLAWRIMEEIAEEKKWSDSFANSLDTLDQLAAEARKDIAEGRVYPLEDIQALARKTYKP